MTLIFRTLSGRTITLPRPEKGQIDVAELAEAVAKLCRFSGHTSRFYSVAEHSLHVTNYLPPHLKIYGLLHDLHEGILGDITTPIKQALTVVFENPNLNKVTARAFSVLDDVLSAAVHTAAHVAYPLDAESEHLLHRADLQAYVDECCFLRAHRDAEIEAQYDLAPRLRPKHLSQADAALALRSALHDAMTTHHAEMATLRKNFHCQPPIL